MTSDQDVEFRELGSFDPVSPDDGEPATIRGSGTFDLVEESLLPKVFTVEATLRQAGTDGLQEEQITPAEIDTRASSIAK